VNLLGDCGIKTIGKVNSKSFIWPVTRDESLELLDYFIENCLPLFGTLQDAMTKKSWSIYHARISFSLNIKLISPKEVIDKTVEYWSVNQHCEINQIEGFIRQILGWREYMRGIYWAKMPEYKSLNFFEHTNKLPNWFWNGNTKMNCLGHSISQSLEYSYAHHIQRLMVTGNFALLAGIDPDEVDAWYLGIYIDAFEWVEITNTRGMSQYADGGIVGSKPYISSASYIDKMSDYCKSCHYNSSEKIGEKACPFNSLYWNFFDRHQDKLRANFRLKMMYSIWDKMDPIQKENILIQADQYLSNIENL
jgi:deoxyribodipyrimidine photolyase-related protein